MEWTALNRQIYEINLATLEKNKKLDCLFGGILNCESHVSAMLVYSDAHTTFPEVESVGGCGVQKFDPTTMSTHD